jgi:SAM-dependent methyltransferase
LHRNRAVASGRYNCDSLLSFLFLDCLQEDTNGYEVAKTFPSAEIVGLDLSPIQPFMVPPNVRFLVDDIEDEWMDRGGYDFINLRHSCMYLQDMDKLINNCYSHLKEGGWLEITDYCTFIRCDDGTMPPGHPVAQVAGMMHKCLLNYGMNGYTINELEQKYENAGFKNIQCRVIKTPIGPWPRVRLYCLLGKTWTVD